MKLSEEVRSHLPKIINDVGHTLVTDRELTSWAERIASLEAELQIERDECAALVAHRNALEAEREKLKRLLKDHDNASHYDENKALRRRVSELKRQLLEKRVK